MLAGVERQKGDALVEMGGQADVDGFSRGIERGLFRIGVLRESGEVEFFGCAAEVALDLGEIAGQLGGSRPATATSSAPGI